MGFAETGEPGLSEPSIILIVGKPAKVKWVQDVYSEVGTVKWSLFEVTLKDFEVVLGSWEKKKLKVLLDDTTIRHFKEYNKIFVFLDVSDENNLRVIHWDPVGETICVGDRVAEELNLLPLLGKFDSVARMKCLFM